MLLSCEEFILRVEELGFMALTNLVPGLPSLSAETPEDNWLLERGMAAGIVDHDTLARKLGL